MIRNMKILGAAVLAVAAMTAVGAAPASAALFHSAIAGTTLEGTQSSQHVFQFGEISVTCDGGTLKGTQATSTAENLTVTPAYTSCDMVIGGVQITVAAKFNGCDYKYGAGGSVSLECPAGQILEITSTVCVWKLPAQTVKSASYDNNGNDIDLTTNLSGLAYSSSGSLCGTTTATNGTFKGTTTLKGKNSEGKEVKIWWE